MLAPEDRDDGARQRQNAAYGLEIRHEGAQARHSATAAST
jgi:hypothetical protein